MILRTILVVLSSLLIGAHFLRHGNLVLVPICLAVPFLLLLRKRWVLIALQCFLYLSAAVWVWYLRILVQQRILDHRPFRGVILILGSAALVTVLAGVLLNSRAVKDRYS
jgi:hypothetical protein